MYPDDIGRGGCGQIFQKRHVVICGWSQSTQSNESGSGNIKLNQVIGKWNEKDDTNTLEDISFEAQNGKLTAIVGPVGSGKGSILNAILGKGSILDSLLDQSKFSNFDSIF